MYIRLNITAALLAGLLSCTIPAAFALEPTQTQLTADVMDYDIESGEFSASGNVVIVRGTLTLKADRGGANSNTQKAHVDGNVHAFGEHEGEPLDAKCDLLESDFSAPEGDYKMTGNVDAMFGTRILRSRTAWLKGRDFGAENVTHFEDKSQNMVLACDVLDGNYDDVGVLAADASGTVHAVQRDEEKDSDLWCDKLVYDRGADTITATGKTRMHVIQKSGSVRDTDITADKMVYAMSSGVVTATGNTKALQDGRRISAKTVVYDTATGKIEARGTPRITVDLSKTENKGKPAPAAGKAASK